jgi:hypothetical protein
MSLMTLRSSLHLKAAAAQPVMGARWAAVAKIVAYGLGSRIG